MRVIFATKFFGVREGSLARDAAKSSTPSLKFTRLFARLLVARCSPASLNVPACPLLSPNQRRSDGSPNLPHQRIHCFLTFYLTGTYKNVFKLFEEKYILAIFSTLIFFNEITTQLNISVIVLRRSKFNQRLV